MRMMKAVCAAVSVFFLAVLPATAENAGADSAAAVTAGPVNGAGFKMFSAMCGDSTLAGKNIFISPYSISCALAMTYEGARENTAAQMRKALDIPGDISALREGYLKLQEDINKGGKNYELSSANSIWPQKGFKFLPDFTGAVLKYYGGAAEEVDYAADKAGAMSRINKWTSDRTNKKIPEIVGEDSVNEMTRLVLVNAVYFKGSWAAAFDPKKTVEMDFNGPKGAEKAMMMRNEGRYMYGEAAGVKLLEMPYKGDELSMLVVLPDGRDLSGLEAELSAKLISSWRRKMSLEKVDVYLPKWKARCMYSMKGYLKGLGMTDAFDEVKADLSGMNGRKNLYVTEVIHGSFVDVNEEGTEAAAATAVVVGLKSVMMEEKQVFKADRPFIYMICDKGTGAVLFLGRLEMPGDTSQAGK